MQKPVNETPKPINEAQKPINEAPMILSYKGLRMGVVGQGRCWQQELFYREGIAGSFQNQQMQNGEPSGSPF